MSNQIPITGCSWSALNWQRSLWTLADTLSLQIIMQTEGCLPRSIMHNLISNTLSWIRTIYKKNRFNLKERPLMRCRVDYSKPLLWKGQRRKQVRSVALVPVPVTYCLHTDTSLLSLILFILFPGEPTTTIAFRANPISQPLILHQNIQSASACTSFSLRRVWSAALKGKSNYLEVREESCAKKPKK